VDQSREGCGVALPPRVKEGREEIVRVYLENSPSKAQMRRKDISSRPWKGVGGRNNWDQQKENKGQEGKREGLMLGQKR